MEQSAFLYEQLAGRLATAIGHGSYAVGERLPSLRHVSRQFGVSLATAVQAYVALEGMGLVEARPKSGYFVRQRGAEEGTEPAPSRPRMQACQVSVGELALDLLARAQEPGLITLGAAVPGGELLPLKSLARLMAGKARQAADTVARYELPAGSPLLRRRIARLLRERACHVDPEELIITNGCMEAVTLSLRAVARPGDSIAIESPSYYGVLQAIEALGMKALELPTDPRTGVDLDALQRVLDRNLVRACLFMPSFNNPLGSAMPLEHRRRVAIMTADAGVPLIEDDIYGDLAFDQPLPPVKSFDTTGNVLLCSSFSKTVAPGYRIGYVAAGAFDDRVRHLKLLGNVATAGLPQLVLADFLKGDGYRRVVRSAASDYLRRTDALRQAVLEYLPEGTRVTQPQGGFVLWVEMPGEVDSMKLHFRALEARIAITPGVIFSPRGDYRNHIRLSCGQVEEAVARRAVETLGRLAHGILEEG